MSRLSRFLLAAACWLAFDTSALAGTKAVGVGCNHNNQCKSGFCDAGWGTSGTNRCVPKPGTGNEGDYCSHPNHCKTAKCNGLKPSGSGGWIAGKCSGKVDLGKSCGHNNECKSGVCDAGWGTSKTNRCVPQAAKGNTGDYCSNHNHCRSRICHGLKPNGAGGWTAGKCHSGGGTAKGSVVDAKGKGVPGVDVCVWDSDNPGGNIKLGCSKTDAQGKYVVDYKAHLDPPDMFGGHTQPDLHLTYEIDRVFSTGNFDGPAGAGGAMKVETPSAALGKRTKIADWPGLKKSVPDHDVTKVLKVPPITVPVDAWQSVRTSFRPELHGFSFVNVERNVCWGPTCKDPWKQLFSTSQALCGGFSLTSMRHWADNECDIHGMKPTADGKLPAALKKEIVTNQMLTFFFWVIPTANDPWTVISPMLPLVAGMPPFDTPGFRFMEWQAKTDEPNQQVGETIGASTKEEWFKVEKELRDRKLPAVLGLINAQAPKFNMLDIDLLTNNHQVLVIGYDHNPFLQAVTLYIYDPNAPDEVQELQFSPKLEKSKMYVDYSLSSKTRGFFVGTRAPAGVKPPTKKCPPPDSDGGV